LKKRILKSCNNTERENNKFKQHVDIMIKKQNNEIEHIKKIGISLKDRHKDETEEINTFQQQLINKHKREDEELNALIRKQRLKINSEEMYSKLMNQKKVWKSADIDMNAWINRRNNKKENRHLKFSRTQQL